MSKIKYTTLLDYIIRILKGIKQVYPTTYLSLVSLLKFLKYNASIGEIQEIGKYIEARGWAKVIFSLGDVKAQITTSGIVYIEGKSAEFEGEFTAFMDEVIKDQGTEQQIETLLLETEEDPKKSIIDLLSRIAEKIKQKEDGASDLLTDIEVIKLELSKLSPDFRLIEIKLNNLNNISYISAELQELKDYLFVPSN